MSSEETQEQPAGGASQGVLNPDGTTNWTVVFEDPEQGILPAVRAVKSETQLRAVMDGVARLLFKRKRDAGPRAEFIARIESMLERVDDAGFDAVQARIVQLLADEKEFRIEKAAIHAKNKATSQSVERRRESVEETALAAFLGNPLYLGGSISAVLAAITVALLYVFVSAGDPDVADQAASSDTQKSADEEAVGQSDAPVAARAQPEPPQTEMVVFRPIVSQVSVGGTSGRLAMVPLVEIEKGQSISKICELSPHIIESVLLRTQSANRAGGSSVASLLNGVASQVTADLNARAGATKISRLRLMDMRKLPRDIVSAANRGCERVRLDANL